MSLWAYVGWRLVQSAVLVLVVVSLCFAIIQMAPGDPVLYLYGAQSVSARPSEPTSAISSGNPRRH